MKRRSVSTQEIEQDNDSQKDVRDLAGGALVNLIGKIGRLVKGTFIYMVTFLFGKHTLGLYEGAWAIISPLQRLATFGLHRGVVRFFVESRVQMDEDQAYRFLTVAIAMVLFVSITVTGLTAIAIDRIAEFYELPELGETLSIMVWTIPSLSLTAVLIGATRALRIMRIDVYVNSILGPLILLVTGGITGYMGWGLPGLAVGQVLMGLGSCTVAAYFFTRHFSLQQCWRSTKKRLPWSEMVAFSLPNMLNDVLTGILMRLDILMLNAFVEPTMVGVYALARRVSSILTKVPESFDPIFSPVVSDLAFRNKHQQLGERFKSIARWTLIITLPLLTGVILAGEQMLLFFDVDSAISTDTLIVLSAGMAIFGLLAPSESLLIMAGKPYRNLLIKILWLGLYFLLNYWLIPDYGIFGAALATVIAMNVVSIIRIVQVYTAYQIHPFGLSLLKPMAAVTIALASVGIGKSLIDMSTFSVNLILFAFFLAVYVLVLKLLGLKEEDRMLLKAMGDGVLNRARQKNDETQPSVL